MELLSKKMDNLNAFSYYPKDASCDLSVGNQDMKGQKDPFSNKVNYMGNF